jgi:hypothetical protein
MRWVVGCPNALVDAQLPVAAVAFISRLVTGSDIAWHFAIQILQTRARRD